MPDKDGYPTKKELKTIVNLDKQNEFVRLVEYLKEIWWMPECGYNFDRKKLVLHTGGWSGNEEIISTLATTMFWTLFWEKSVRGGHYYFKGIKDRYDTH